MDNISEQYTHQTSQAKRGALAQILHRLGKNGNFNLSLGQQRRWFLHKLAPGYRSDHLFSAFDVYGSLDVDLLQQCINKTVSRHESLRATFTELEGRPIKIVAPFIKLGMPVEDLREISEMEKEICIKHLASEEVKRPFDLNKGPLLRLRLFRVGEEHHILFITMHSIISDSRSMDIFMREIALLYQASVEGKRISQVPPFQFSNYIAWEREWLQSKEMERHLSYWRQSLEDVPVLDLPLDKPRPSIKTHRGASQCCELPVGVFVSLKQLAQSENVSLFMLLLGAFQIMLARYSRQEDVAVGSPVANRLNPKWKESIGPFENTLVFRTDISGDPSFIDLMGRVFEVCHNTFVHQKVQFERLVNELQPKRDLSHTPLFQAMFLFRNMPVPSFKSPYLSFVWLNTETVTTLYDLALSVIPIPHGLNMRFEFNIDLFDNTTIKLMLGQFCRLLEGITEDPGRRLSQLPLITEKENHQLLEWNQTTRPYPGERCLHELFEAQVECSPYTNAVVCNERRLTYHELNQRANRLAHYLRSLGVGPEMLVGIAAERSAETLISILAILKAGGAYVPLDPNYPPARLGFMLEDSKVKIILTPPHLRDRLPAGNHTIICFDTYLPEIAGQPETNPGPLAAPENLAYVIYTSGSTGKPKGVLIQHRHIVHSTSARFADRPLPSAFLLLLSFSFDASGVGIYWTLCRGGRLVIPTDHQMQDLRLLCGIIEKEKISHIDCAPSLYTLLLDTDVNMLRSLRYVIVGGEACPPHLVDKHRRFLPDACLVNNYGPTEAAIWCTRFECHKWQGPALRVPIGRPIQNARIYLLDRQLNPAPVNIPGELYIGGEGVACGYLNRPSLTAERFIPNPFSLEPGERLYRTGDLARYLPDGNIEFLGRIDNQVKIRGFRIELGEIESALHHHQKIEEAAVTAREDIPGDKRLIAYIVSHHGSSPSRDGLISFLEERLPSYMVPRYFVFLDKLPRSPTGKIDYKALPAPKMQRQTSKIALVAPRTTLEKELAKSITPFLRIDKVGINDDLFDLGLDSLSVVKLVSNFSEMYGIDLQVKEIFQEPTIAGMAEVIEIYRKDGQKAVTASWDAKRLEAESVLDPEITQEGLPMANILDPSCILLTGATGYLGAFLLERLLRETKADVFCLVRASNIEEGMERIKKNLRKYLIWDDSFVSRLHPVSGDLTKPLLGLQPSIFHELAAVIDTIYHGGALVNFVYPYSAMKKPNVFGTQEVLRFACQVKAKAVHFFSTIDVLLEIEAPRPFLEVDLPANPAKIPDGYGRTKWVSEKIMTIARSRGIPVCIYRLGHVIGHTETGVTPTTDHLAVALKGFFKLGILPELTRLFNAIPVDYAARVILHLSRQENSFGKTFHIWNTRDTTFMEVYKYIESFGYKLDIVPYNIARDRIINVDTSNPLYPLRPLFPETWYQPSSLDPVVQKGLDRREECSNMLKQIKGRGIKCMPVNEKFLHLIFSYLIDVGFIDPPDKKTLT